MKEKIAFLSIFANFFLATIKILAGYFSYSTAVLAEGFHSLADIFSSLISYFGIKMAKKPADEKHPYGHFKFEVLAGFLITLILLGTGIYILWESWEKFQNLTPLSFPKLALFAMALSALINELMARLKIYYGKKENSVALISDGLHSRVDVLSSLAIFVGLVFSRKYLFLDPLLAFLVGIWVVRESFSLGKEAVDSLLDVSAPPEIENKIKEICYSQKVKLSHLRTQKKGSVFTANLEIELPKDLSVDQAEKIAQSLREKLMAEIKNLVYVAIQIKSHEAETSFYRPLSPLGMPIPRRGFGWGGRRRRGRFGGPGGFCVCPNCNYKIPHQRGVPCASLICPRCKIPLQREL